MVGEIPFVLHGVSFLPSSTVTMIPRSEKDIPVFTFSSSKGDGFWDEVIPSKMITQNQKLGK